MMGKCHCDFSAIINKLGMNPFVDVPEHVSQCFGKRGYIRVTGTLNGVPIRATLVPTGKGRHRLYVNGEMRKKANVKVGDAINLSFRLDTEPMEVAVPRELVEALESNEKARTAFERLPPSHQKEILDYLNFLKKPESLKRDVEKVSVRLSNQRKRLERQKNRAEHAGSSYGYSSICARLKAIHATNMNATV